MKQLLCLSVLFLALTGCIKEDPTETYYLDPEFYQYVLAPKGSWWVYEEENSGARDTVTVISYRQWISDIEEPKYNEEASLDLKSSFSNVNYQINSSTIGKKDTGGICDAKFYGSGHYCFFTGMVHGQQIGDVYGIRSTYLEKDEIEINSVIYNNIIIVENKNNRNPANPCNIDFYSAKGVGIIKRTDCDGKIWNLIDYHINF